jgi:hypothetical protein
MYHLTLHLLILFTRATLDLFSIKGKIYIYREWNQIKHTFLDIGYIKIDIGPINIPAFIVVSFIAYYFIRRRSCQDLIDWLLGQLFLKLFFTFPKIYICRFIVD